MARSPSARRTWSSSVIVAISVLAMVAFGALIELMSTGGPLIGMEALLGVTVAAVSAGIVVRWLEARFDERTDGPRASRSDRADRGDVP